MLNLDTMDLDITHSSVSYIAERVGKVSSRLYSDSDAKGEKHPTEICCHPRLPTPGSPSCYRTPQPEHIKNDNFELRVTHKHPGGYVLRLFC